MAEDILHQSSPNSPTVKRHVHTNHLYSRDLVRNFQEARAVNDEFRRRLEFGKGETYKDKIKRDLQRLR